MHFRSPDDSQHHASDYPPVPLIAWQLDEGQLSQYKVNPDATLKTELLKRTMYNMSAWLRLFHRTIQDKYKRKPRIMIRWALAFIFAAASFEIKIATVKAVAIPGGFESSADSRAVVATTRHGAEGGAGDAEISDDYDSGIIQMRKMLAASSSNGIMGADLEQLLVDKIPVDQFDSSFGGDQNLDSGIPGITTLVGAGSSFAKRLHQVR